MVMTVPDKEDGNAVASSMDGMGISHLGHQFVEQWQRKGRKSRAKKSSEASHCSRAQMRLAQLAGAKECGVRVHAR